MERVIDGDTIVVQGVGTVRLIGVDTPETVDPHRPVEAFGKEASDSTRRLATGKIARLEYDTDRKDRYGRTLAYVFLPDGTFLNAEIVRQGYGHAYTAFPFRFLEQFRAHEREARAPSRGLWAGGDAALMEGPPCADINAADVSELLRIVHIGPGRAEWIVRLRSERPFRSVNDLTAVDAIGAGRLREIVARVWRV